MNALEEAKRALAEGIEEHARHLRNLPDNRPPRLNERDAGHVMALAMVAQAEALTRQAAALERIAAQLELAFPVQGTDYHGNEMAVLNVNVLR